MIRNARRPGHLRFEALEGRALLSGAGTPDPTFGGDTGYSSVSLGVPSNTPFAVDGNNFGDSAAADSVVALPNGNVAVTGVINALGRLATEDYSDVAISEVGPGGGAVASFGGGGLVLLPAEVEGGHFVAVAEPNGDIVVAGGVGEDTGFAAVELDSRGAAVTGFGSNGLAQYPAGSTTPAADRLGSVYAALLQPDGKIVLVGSSGGADGPGAVAAVRLNPDGSIDASFGQGGTVDVPVTVNHITNARATAAALQANGQVVVAGDAASGLINEVSVSFPAQENFALRLNADGSLDTTYGVPSAAGIVLMPPDPANPTALAQSQVLGIAIDPTSGDVLISGTEQGDGQANVIDGATLYRFNGDGEIDENFRVGSMVRPGVAGPVVVQPDGDIVIAGTLTNQGTDEETGLVQAAGVLRLLPEGQPDANFGNSTTPGLFLAHAPDLDQVGGLAIVPGTGALVVGGSGTEPALAGGGVAPSTGVRDLDFTAVRLLPTAFPTVPPARTPATAPADFTGSGYTDIALFNPTNATFSFQSPNGQEAAISFGISGYNQTIPAPADYLGIGSDQVAAYLPSLGVYAILPSAGYTTTGGGGSPGLAIKFGLPGSGETIPTPADFDGDGKADVAIYLPGYASFAILPSDGSAPYSVPFGAPGAGNSIPVPADYFGFGRADVAVYLPQIGAYAIRNPISGGDTIIPFGKAGYGGSIPVPGDYDGSGKVELAVYVPSLGAFFYRPAAGGPDVEMPMGTPDSDDVPVPGDYDGAGHDEAAIYDEAGGYIEYKPADGGPDVIKFTDSTNTSSVPLAELPGNTPDFNVPPPPPPPIIPGAKVGALSIAPPTGSGSTAGTTPAVKASATPAGPTFGTARIPRSLVNQAIPDPIR